jgi:hypothetical protein
MTVIGRRSASPLDLCWSDEEVAGAGKVAWGLSFTHAPFLKRAYGIAAKVTEKLIEPPRIRRREAFMLPLALVSTNRVSRRNRG